MRLFDYDGSTFELNHIVNITFTINFIYVQTFIFSYNKTLLFLLFNAFSFSSINFDQKYVSLSLNKYIYIYIYPYKVNFHNVIF